MSNEIKDANLNLLIELKRHLEQADRLRASLDRLIGLATNPSKPKPKAKDRKREAVPA